MIESYLPIGNKLDIYQHLSRVSYVSWVTFLDAQKIVRFNPKGPATLGTHELRIQSKDKNSLDGEPPDQSKGFVYDSNPHLKGD